MASQNVPRPPKMGYLGVDPRGECLQNDPRSSEAFDRSKQAVRVMIWVHHGENSYQFFSRQFCLKVDQSAGCDKIYEIKTFESSECWSLYDGHNWTRSIVNAWTLSKFSRKMLRDSRRLWSLHVTDRYTKGANFTPSYYITIGQIRVLPFGVLPFGRGKSCLHRERKRIADWTCNPMIFE